MVESNGQVPEYSKQLQILGQGSNDGIHCAFKAHEAAVLDLDSFVRRPRTAFLSA